MLAWFAETTLVTAGLTLVAVVASRLRSVWAAPHFLVQLKWEFFERSNIDRNSYAVIREPVLLLSQDALNSFGVA
jgi:hypothetical protein